MAAAALVNIRNYCSNTSTESALEHDMSLDNAAFCLMQNLFATPVVGIANSLVCMLSKAPLTFGDRRTCNWLEQAVGAIVSRLAGFKRGVAQLSWNLAVQRQRRQRVTHTGAFGTNATSGYASENNPLALGVST
jgi:hypothetical protein